MRARNTIQWPTTFEACKYDSDSSAGVLHGVLDDGASTLADVFGDNAFVREKVKGAAV